MEVEAIDLVADLLQRTMSSNFDSQTPTNSGFGSAADRTRGVIISLTPPRREQQRALWCESKPALYPLCSADALPDALVRLIKAVLFTDWRRLLRPKSLVTLDRVIPISSIELNSSPRLRPSRRQTFFRTRCHLLTSMILPASIRRSSYPSAQATGLGAQQEMQGNVDRALDLPQHMHPHSSPRPSSRMVPVTVARPNLELSRASLWSMPVGLTAEWTRPKSVTFGTNDSSWPPSLLAPSFVNLL